MKKTVKVLQLQNIFDLSIQHCGSIEDAFNILSLNSSKIPSMSESIKTDTLLVIPSVVKNKEMVDYYKVNNLFPANGIEVLPGLPPVQITLGDFNTDYNNDFKIIYASL